MGKVKPQYDRTKVSRHTKDSKTRWKPILCKTKTGRTGKPPKQPSQNWSSRPLGRNSQKLRPLLPKVLKFEFIVCRNVPTFKICNFLSNIDARGSFSIFSTYLDDWIITIDTDLIPQVLALFIFYDGLTRNLIIITIFLLTFVEPLFIVFVELRQLWSKNVSKRQKSQNTLLKVETHNRDYSNWQGNLVSDRCFRSILGPIFDTQKPRSWMGVKPTKTTENLWTSDTELFFTAYEGLHASHAALPATSPQYVLWPRCGFSIWG